MITFEIFFFFRKNIGCDLSLEPSPRERGHKMILWRTNKISPQKITTPRHCFPLAEIPGSVELLDGVQWRNIIG